MSLRILHALLTVDPEADGLMENVRLLSAVNRHLKHRIEVLTLADTDADAPWRHEPGVSVHEVGAGLTRGRAKRKFVQRLRECAGGYDCVLVSGALGFDAHRVWRALRAAGVPYFVFSPRYLGFLRGADRQLEKTKQRFLWPWAGYPLLRDAHAVFFENEEARREAPGLFWPYDCHEFVLPCGVAEGAGEGNAAATDAFLAGHPALAGKRLFTVLASEHGAVPEALLDAVRSLSDTGRWDRDAMRLVFAGFAKEGAEAAEALRRAVARRGLGDVVYSAGALDGEGRRALLEASEVLVQPARADNSGRAVPEAFSAGKPVLIAKGINLWREVVANAAGFADDDSRAGYMALFSWWWWQETEDRAVLGANARQGFEMNYNEQAAANTLLAMIYLLIGASQPGGEAGDPEVFRHEVDFL